MSSERLPLDLRPSAYSESQRVQHEVRDLVVAVDDQHDLVVFLRPLAVDQIILRPEQRAHELPVFPREHLLPGVHHRVSRAEGRKVAAVVAAEGRAHRALQQLRDVGLDDVVVRVLRVDVHIQIVGVLHGADMRGHLRVGLQMPLEGLEVVGLLLGGDHGVHHVVEDGARVDGVLLVLVLLRLGLHAHQRGHEVGHVHALGLDGDGIARQRVLLHLVDVVLDAV